MPTNHNGKYLSNLIITFATVTAGVFIIVYSVFNKTKESEWYFWAILAAFLINVGLYSLLNAVVHKVKSDFIRKQRSRDHNRSGLDSWSTRNFYWTWINPLLPGKGNWCYNSNAAALSWSVLQRRRTPRVQPLPVSHSAGSRTIRGPWDDTYLHFSIDLIAYTKKARRGRVFLYPPPNIIVHKSVVVGEKTPTTAYLLHFQSDC